MGEADTWLHHVEHKANLTIRGVQVFGDTDSPISESSLALDSQYSSGHILSLGESSKLGSRAWGLIFEC